MNRKATVALSVAGLLAASGGFVYHRVATSRRTFDYKPVTRPAAIDRWQPAWTVDPPGGREAGGPPRKWVVMGWDGASWDVILPLLEAGKLPHLASLIREGVYGKLLTFVPTQSAAVWTSVATGVSPRRHGILGFAKPPAGVDAVLTALGRRGRPTALFSSADRRTKALWNLASEYGRKVMVVGYHNTFPAERVSGLMVSNYLVRQATMTAIPGAKPEGVEAAKHLAYPPTALREIAPLSQRIEDLRLEDVRRFADVDETQFGSLMAEYKAHRADVRWSYLCRAYAYDAFHARVAERLRSEYDPDLLLLHFQGTDWAAHHFLYFHWPERFARMPRAKQLHEKLDAELPRYRKTVAAFYEHADEWLGKLLEGADPATGVLVLSDHGMDLQDHYRETGAHEGAPPGILVLKGPGIVRGRRIDGATVYDVLPTLMAGAGMPVARDLDGHVLTEAFDPAVLRGVSYVPSYETGSRYVPQVDAGAELHREVEEELRGLGYIE